MPRMKMGKAAAAPAKRAGRDGELEALWSTFVERARSRREHLRSATQDAIEAGEALIAMRERLNLRHGEWLPWLEERCNEEGIGVSTARMYERMARRVRGNDELRAEVVEMTEAEADRFLADHWRAQDERLALELGTYRDRLVEAVLAVRDLLVEGSRQFGEEQWAKLMKTAPVDLKAARRLMAQSTSYEETDRKAPPLELLLLEDGEGSN